MAVIIQEPTLKEIIKDAWKSKIYILLFGVVFFFISVLLVYFMKPFYKAEAIISSSFILNNIEEEKDSAVSMENIINFDDLFISYQQILTGPVTAKAVINDRVRKIAEQDCIFKGCNREFVIWNSQEFSDYIRDKVKIEPVAMTNFRKITYEHPDKESAVYMISVLHEQANNIIKSRIEKSLEKRIDYLKKSLEGDLYPDNRKAVVKMLMQYEYILMLTRVEEYIAAKYIEPVYVSNKSVWPRKYIFITVFIFVGMLLGYVIAGIRKS